MPWKSDAQRRYTYAMANKGKKWAQKFVSDARVESSKPAHERNEKLTKRGKKG